MRGRVKIVFIGVAAAAALGISALFICSKPPPKADGGAAPSLDHPSRLVIPESNVLACWRPLRSMTLHADADPNTIAFDIAQATGMPVVEFRPDSNTPSRVSVPLAKGSAIEAAQRLAAVTGLGLDVSRHAIRISKDIPTFLASEILGPILLGVRAAKVGVNDGRYQVVVSGDPGCFETWIAPRVTVDGKEIDYDVHMATDADGLICEFMMDGNVSHAVQVVAQVHILTDLKEVRVAQAGTSRSGDLDIDVRKFRKSRDETEIVFEIRWANGWSNEDLRQYNAIGRKGQDVMKMLQWRVDGQNRLRFYRVSRTRGLGKDNETLAYRILRISARPETIAGYVAVSGEAQTVEISVGREFIVQAEASLMVLATPTSRPSSAPAGIERNP